MKEIRQLYNTASFYLLFAMKKNGPKKNFERFSNNNSMLLIKEMQQQDEGKNLTTKKGT